MTAARPRIAAICACPPGFNPGMHIVDAALTAVVGRSVKRFLLYLPSELRALGHGDSVVENFGLPFRYHRLRGRLPEVERSDVILFWGDFLHSRHYRNAVASILARLGVDRRAVFPLIDDHLFLARSDESVLRKTILVGECLRTGLPDVAPDDLYTRNLGRLVNGCRSVHMRDIESALRVSQLRDSFTRVRLGIDGALLLRPDDHDRLFGTRRRRIDPARVGVCFARTLPRRAVDPSAAVRGMVKFARRLCRAARATPVWIPWLGPPSRDLRWTGEVSPRASGTGVGPLVESLRRCAFVITDVYHLSLVAWSHGIPALTVGEGVRKFHSSLSDKKKEIFASMYGSEPHYVFAEAALDDQRDPSVDRGDADIDRLVALARDRDATALVCERIERHRTQAIADVSAEIAAVLA